MTSSHTELATVYNESFKDSNYVKHLGGVLETLGDTPLRTIIRLAASNFPKNATIRLGDLGCGEGRDLAAFSNFFSHAGFDQVHLLGCEISEVAVELCHSRGLTVECMDMESFLTREKEPFSILWSHFSIIHFEDQEIGPLLSLLARKLVPGGILGIGFKAGDGSRILDPKDDTCRVDRETTYFRYDAIADILLENGFDLRASISIPSSGRPVPHQYAWIIGVKS